MGKQEMVMIELDRPRELRFGHKALKTLLALTGKDIDSLQMDTVDPEEMEKYIYCGLLSDAREHKEDLKPEHMEDLLDQAPSYAHVIERLGQALNLAFGAQADGETGNPPAPAERPADGTGAKV